MYSARQPVPLGLTGVLCDSHTVRVPPRSGNDGTGSANTKLHYTVFRPRNLQYKPPLVCVAGGPHLPSNYLSPLVHLVTDRSIVLYDSTTAPPADESSRSNSSSSGNRSEEEPNRLVESMVNDLDYLVGTCLPPDCEDYCLFGHSFGGIVVYEYLLKQHQKKLAETETKTKTCRSAVLAGTPVSVEDCERHCQELLNSIREEMGLSGGAAAGGPSSAADGCTLDGDDAEAVQRAFRQRHECRVDPLPLPLQQSFEKAGYASSRSSAGLRAVRGYSAMKAAAAAGKDGPDAGTTTTDKMGLPPVLILRGQHDFVTEESCEAWLKIWRGNSKSGNASVMTLAGCSHYGMVEMESLFGSVLSAFLRDHDPKNAKPFVPKRHPIPPPSSNNRRTKEAK